MRLLPWPRRLNHRRAPKPIWHGSIPWSPMTEPLKASLRRSLAILALVVIVTAWFSETFYFPDEHYQILEFMAFKLGITPASELPWEYGAHIRPWFQPLVYFLIAKPLVDLAVKDMFVIVFLLRLLTGLFLLLRSGVCPARLLAMFARAILPAIAGEEETRLCPLSSPLGLSRLAFR